MSACESASDGIVVTRFVSFVFPLNALGCLKRPQLVLALSGGIPAGANICSTARFMKGETVTMASRLNLAMLLVTDVYDGSAWKGRSS
jgi:hypothetical protein